METTPPTVSSTNNTNRPKLNLSLDVRWISLGLLAVIVAMLLLWQPWHTSSASNTRTVSVSGEATVKATPDEYGFSPSYEFKNSDKATAIKDAGAKQTEVVAKLKALGVADSHIKNNINGYRDYSPTAGVSSQSDIVPVPGGSGNYIYTLQLNITVATRDEAQKVQDYLATTSPSGSVTPQAQFSDMLRKKLEAQARDSATKDARAKADQSAKNLGFSVGSVKSVDDGSGFGGGIMPMQTGIKAMATDSSAAQPNISVQPGENDLSYSVTVVYYIK